MLHGNTGWIPIKSYRIFDGSIFFLELVGEVKTNYWIIRWNSVGRMNYGIVRIEYENRWSKARDVVRESKRREFKLIIRPIIPRFVKFNGTITNYSFKKSYITVNRLDHAGIMFHSFSSRDFLWINAKVLLKLVINELLLIITMILLYSFVFIRAIQFKTR